MSERFVSIDNIFYRATPLICGLLGIGLAFGSYLINYFNGHFYAWGAIVLLQGGLGYLYGKLLRRLYQGAYTDVLTELWNRRYFSRKLDEELGRSARYGSSLCMIMIDVDNFKEVNDRFGHVAGDQILRALGEVFRVSTRAIDSVFRWGGDEFSVLLPDTELADAVCVAERIRRNVQEDMRCCHITISAGVTVVPQEIVPKDLVTMADQVLYRAKQKKNCVVSMCNERLPV